jgi:membrane protease YdiL (CAAX protease family)
MTSLPAAEGHPAPPERPEAPTGGGRRDDAIPPWPAWMAPAALFTGFAAALFCALVIGLVAGIFGAGFGSANAPASVSILSTIAQDACLIGAAYAFARMVALPRPEQFGLRMPRIKTALAYIAGGYLAFIVISLAWLALIGQPDAKDTITEDLGAKDSTVALIAVTFIVCVCAPLAEEFFFRGFFFGALRKNGFWPAALLTGLAFGVVHVFGSPIAFIVPLALLGAGLCYIREKTASLYPGIGLHCLNNTVAMSSSEHWSWQVPVVLVLAPSCIALFVWLGLRVWPTDRPAPASGPATVGAPTA